MKFNKFKIHIFVRLILLSANVAIICLSLEKSALVLILLSAIFIWQVVSFFQYLNRANQDLLRLFESIQYDDFSISFSRKSQDTHLDELYDAFNKVLNNFRAVRAKSEEYRHFLQTVVQHVGIPLLAFDAEGKVELINSATKKFLKINRLRQLSELPSHLNSLEKEWLTLKNGQKKNIKINTLEGSSIASMYGIEFVIDGKLVKLITLVNISRELDEKELESWLSLMKVLTHEIMNSLTPISSLSNSAKVLINQPLPDDEKITQLYPAIETIERRTAGMINFINSFRSLTTLPKPNFELVLVKTLLEEAVFLHSAIQRNFKVEFNSEVAPSSLQITADRQLILQVLDNLINNAIEACAGMENCIITLTAKINDDGQIIISVQDNGHGILPEVQEKIFIPFFSTKKTGTGIGLSLSKLIMQAHLGTIKLESESMEGAKFSLVF